MDILIGIEAIETVDGPLAYLLVFVFAAVPVVEVLVVIPFAIAVGLDPLLVGVAAAVGNLTTVCAVVVASDWSLRFVRRRYGDPTDDTDSKTVRRGRRIWDRYGLPGVALAAPVTTGVHLAAVLGLAFGSSRRRVLGWMTGSLVLWSSVLAAASWYGMERLLWIVG
jgi:hypothetical protein